MQDRWVSGWMSGEKFHESYFSVPPAFVATLRSMRSILQQLPRISLPMKLLRGLMLGITKILQKGAIIRLGGGIMPL